MDDGEFSRGGFIPGPPVRVSLDDRECIVRMDNTRRVTCHRGDVVHAAYHAVGLADTDKDDWLR